MLIIKTIMNNPDSLIKSLNSLKTENEKKQFVNQKLTTFYLSNDADSLCLIFNNSQFNKYIDISFKNGANFEHAYIMAINGQPNIFSDLLIFLEKTNQIDRVQSENINNCLLSSTLSRHKNIDQAKQQHKPLLLIYNHNILRSKISIDYSDYAIVINLSNQKNIYMADFLIEHHHNEIISNHHLHKKLKSIAKQEFSSYLMNNSLSLIMKNKKDNELAKKHIRIKI